MNNISKIIRAILKIYNLNQVDFSVKSEIPLSTVKKYLQGAFNPTKKNIEKIESCFDVMISKILKTDLSNLDKLEEVEVYFKSLEKKVLVDLEGLEQLENLMILDYNGMQIKYDGNFFEDLEEARKEKEKLKNTISLIKTLESDLKKEIKEEKNENFNTAFFIHSDKLLIKLLQGFGFSFKRKGKKFIFTDRNGAGIECNDLELLHILSFLKKNLISSVNLITTFSLEFRELQKNIDNIEQNFDTRIFKNLHEIKEKLKNKKTETSDTEKETD